LWHHTYHSSSSLFLACNSRLRSAIRRHHPPQRAVLSQICCFGEHKMVMFQILLDGAEPCDAGTTQLSSPVCRRGGQQDPLGICVVVHATYLPLHTIICCSVIFGVILRPLVVNTSSLSPVNNTRCLPAVFATVGAGVCITLVGRTVHSTR